MVSIVRTVALTLVLIYLAGIASDVIKSLKSLAFLVILAVFFAYLIDPLVKFIRKPFKERNLEKVMPRWLAIGIAYLLVFLVLGIGISFLAPRLIEQAKEFAGNLPAYAEMLKEKLTNLNSRYENIQIPPEVKEEVNNKITNFAGELTTWITATAGVFFISALGISPFFLLVPVISFFFLKDVNLFKVTFLRMFPSGNWRARAEGLLGDFDKTLAAYTRAQLISCFLIGTICTIIFYFLGVDYALLLGIVAGILEFIPLIGPLIIAVTAVTVSGFESAQQAILVAVFLIVLRIVHDYITYPRIVREGIHLHPLAIILSILAGEQIAGIPGVFLAIPTVALLTVTYRHIIEHRGSRGFVADLLDNRKENNEEELEETKA